MNEHIAVRTTFYINSMFSLQPNLVIFLYLNTIIINDCLRYLMKIFWSQPREQEAWNFKRVLMKLENESISGKDYFKTRNESTSHHGLII